MPGMISNARTRNSTSREVEERMSIFMGEGDCLTRLLESGCCIQQRMSARRCLVGDFGLMYPGSDLIQRTR